MIFGITGYQTTKKNIPGLISENGAVTVDSLGRLFIDESEFQTIRYTAKANDALAVITSNGVPALDESLNIYQDKNNGSFAAFHGNLYNRAELITEFISNKSEIADLTNSAEIVLNLFLKLGKEIFKILNGSFALSIWDAKKQEFYLIRDHLGIEPIYYTQDDDVLYFSSDLKRLTRIPGIGNELHSGVLQRYLLFNYNPGYETLFADIHALRPGFYLTIKDGTMKKEQYWKPSFANTLRKSSSEYKSELLELIEDAVRIRLAPDKFRPGAFLSGGMDSSTIVHYMSRLLQQSFSTFSFRCRGKSYDESYYAKIMSSRYNTLHSQIEYSAEEAADCIAKIAQVSQEPFSDIGIEVASYLLGDFVKDHADYVLTGDGGDELFGGHPVYLADRMAKRFDKLPAAFRGTLTKILQKLPDPESKKNLMVKAKRFSYSSSFPAALHSNRWRVYYTDEELRGLCHSDFLENSNGFNPFQQLLDIYEETDSQDDLSQTLYGDYYSVVGFYLRRMELIRHFGVDGRMPLLDYRLVEYTARIPSDLKIDKSGQTKVLLHDIMAGELPDEIVFRTDKLGHSVPMKNWVREKPVIQDLFDEYLSPSAVKRRGFFNSHYIERLREEHRRSANNNSHRLWSLLLLELWFRSHYDDQKVNKV